MYTLIRDKIYRYELYFLMTLCIWVDYDRLVFIVTPKSLAEEHVSIRESLRWIWGWAFTTRLLLPLDVMNKTLHLVECIDLRFCLHQVSTWNKSYERVVTTSSKDLLCTDKVVFYIHKWHMPWHVYFVFYIHKRHMPWHVYFMFYIHKWHMPWHVYFVFYVHKWHMPWHVYFCVLHSNVAFSMILVSAIYTSNRTIFKTRLHMKTNQAINRVWLTYTNNKMAIYLIMTYVWRCCYIRDDIARDTIVQWTRLTGFE